MIPRILTRTLLVCAAMTVLAFMSNHREHPCTDTQVGAGGMCVTVSASR